MNMPAALSAALKYLPRSDMLSTLADSDASLSRSLLCWYLFDQHYLSGYDHIRPGT